MRGKTKKNIFFNIPSPFSEKDCFLVFWSRPCRRPVLWSVWGLFCRETATESSKKRHRARAGFKRYLQGKKITVGHGGGGVHTAYIYIYYYDMWLRYVTFHKLYSISNCSLKRGLCFSSGSDGAHLIRIQIEVSVEGSLQWSHRLIVQDVGPFSFFRVGTAGSISMGRARRRPFRQTSATATKNMMKGGAGLQMDKVDESAQEQWCRMSGSGPGCKMLLTDITTPVACEQVLLFL